MSDSGYVSLTDLNLSKCTLVSLKPVTCCSQVVVQIGIQSWYVVCQFSDAAISQQRRNAKRAGRRCQRATANAAARKKQQEMHAAHVIMPCQMEMQGSVTPAKTRRIPAQKQRAVAGRFHCTSTFGNLKGLLQRHIDLQLAQRFARLAQALRCGSHGQVLQLPSLV